ncbi:MAG: MBL fold metallo-hydrolase, partial [archaeon]|nr:MBL fold metallo-hydrolase [archaeon]
LQIRAFYAGHVLGACMFWVSAGGQSVVYTGDYNMTPDRHLGAARIERLRPDLLITETTYATTIRDSKRIRERDFLKRTHRCVERGGKVLIPVFALGRAQELCILVETYWERMNLGHIPVYFSAGLTEKANLYYKLFISWTNEKIKSTFVERNLFDFRFIKPFERSFADEPGPMVLFATPGMLHAGTSLDVFKKWAPNPLNLVVIPGFCVVGTVGNRLLAGREHKGKAQRVVIDQHTTVDVRCKIKYLSFSAHADAKGIKQLIRQVAPRHVMLVHGEKEKMEHLSSEIEYEFGLSCYFPPNGVTINVPTSCDVPVDLSVRLITSHQPSFTSLDAPTSSSSSYDSSLIDDPEDPLLEGILLVNPDNSFQVVSKEEVSDTYGFPLHDLQRSSIHPIPEKFALSESELVTRLFDLLQLIESPFAPESSATTSSSSSSTSTSSALANPSRHGGKIVRLENGLSMGTVILDVRDGNATVTWKHYDQDLASRIIATVIAVISPESMKPSDSSSNTNNSSRSRPIDDNPKPPQPKLQRTR